jgi:hypothetical protein
MAYLGKVCNIKCGMNWNIRETFVILKIFKMFSFAFPKTVIVDDEKTVIEEVKLCCGRCGIVFLTAASFATKENSIRTVSMSVLFESVWAGGLVAPASSVIPP